MFGWGSQAHRQSAIAKVRPVVVQWNGLLPLNGIVMCQTKDLVIRKREEMMTITCMGIDLAKQVFQIHGVNKVNQQRQAAPAKMPEL